MNYNKHAKKFLDNSFFFTKKKAVYTEPNCVHRSIVTQQLTS